MRPGNLNADSTVNLPNLTSGTTRLVGHDTTDTLTNKTLTSPIINTVFINRYKYSIRS